jgi:hypothetical protein
VRRASPLWFFAFRTAQGLVARGLEDLPEGFGGPIALRRSWPSKAGVSEGEVYREGAVPVPLRLIARCRLG